jgi:methyltransferase domain
MENHTNKTYQKRMNKTALSKFGVIEKHLDKGIKLLDFGSGFSPEFIEQVQQTGAHYIAYDVSQIVQNQLKENNIDFLTKEQFQNTEDEFDVIYLSSVFHELMSYLSRPERRETFAMLDKALKPEGVIVIRDWGPGYQSRQPVTLEAASDEVNDEVKTWVDALVKNSVINTLLPLEDGADNVIVPHIYKGGPRQLYEILFHVVWGLNSLERESQESYAIDPYLIEKWICRPHGYEITTSQEEYDETYLPYLQKYFKIEDIPWPTKIIYELRKTK